MNFNSAAFGDFRARLRKTLLFAFVLINLLTPQIYAQTNFTRNQFSRFPVLTRAAYFENEILKAANAHGVDPNVLWAIAYNETRFRPWLTSPKNAQGLMQFIPSTAARYDLTNPYEPASAIRAAARYVKYLSNLFGGRIDSILAAYNSGEGTVTAFLTGKTLRSGQKIINGRGQKTIGGVPPYAETIAYVGRGLKIYRWLILRGIFPVNVVRANFPTVISASVARVTLVDYELGKVPDFNKIAITQATAQIPKVSEMVKETNEPNTEQNPQNNSITEVFYDSRSGNRYAVNNGNKIKLNESGVMVINTNSRPETTNNARSTFVAASAKK